jgi:hypothetical protein
MMFPAFTPFSKPDFPTAATSFPVSEPSRAMPFCSARGKDDFWLQKNKNLISKLRDIDLKHYYDCDSHSR